VIMLANDIGLGRVGSNFFTCSGLGWVALGHSADGLGWIGSHKMDPWTTLLHRFEHVCVQRPAYADYMALPAFAPARLCC